MVVEIVFSEACLIQGAIMSLVSAIFDLAAVLVIAVLVWDRAKLSRRLAELSDRCQTAQLENSRLDQTRSASEAAEMERFLRLEHDLRSTISVIAGFSALIRESVEKDPSPSPLLLLKGANAIQQSTAKAVRILEAAAQDNPSDRRKGLALERTR